MGPRIREDNGRGICAGKTGMVRWNNGWVGGTGGSRTAPTGEGRGCPVARFLGSGLLRSE